MSEHRGREKLLGRKCGLEKVGALLCQGGGRGSGRGMVTRVRLKQRKFSHVVSMGALLSVSWLRAWGGGGGGASNI